MVICRGDIYQLGSERALITWCPTNNTPKYADDLHLMLGDGSFITIPLEKFVNNVNCKKYKYINHLFIEDLLNKIDGIFAQTPPELFLNKDKGLCGGHWVKMEH